MTNLKSTITETQGGQTIPKQPELTCHEPYDAVFQSQVATSKSTLRKNCPLLASKLSQSLKRANQLTSNC
jgi:hypothetical protein